MKNKFLTLLLTAALTFGGVTVSLAPLPQAFAATVPITMPDDVKEQVKFLSDEELVAFLELTEANSDDDEISTEEIYNASMLQNDCTFIMGEGAVHEYSSNGCWTYHLGSMTEEVLRLKFPEVFKDIPSPLYLDAGIDAEEVSVNYYQMKDAPDSALGVQPDFEKIIKILSRGPYTVAVSGTAKTNYTTNVKLNKQYTITATYEAKASDGGEFELSYMRVEAKYNRKKPTHLTIEIYSNTGETQTIQTFKLKMSKSLQTKIRTGKVILTGTNISSYQNESNISKDIDTTGGKTSGTVKLNFKFIKAKK